MAGQQQEETLKDQKQETSRKVGAVGKRTDRPQTRSFPYTAETVTMKFTAAVTCTLAGGSTCSSLIILTRCGDQRLFTIGCTTLGELLHMATSGVFSSDALSKDLHKIYAVNKNVVLKNGDVVVWELVF